MLEPKLERDSMEFKEEVELAIEEITSFLVYNLNPKIQGASIIAALGNVMTNALANTSIDTKTGVEIFNRLISFYTELKSRKTAQRPDSNPPQTMRLEEEYNLARRTLAYCITSNLTIFKDRDVLSAVSADLLATSLSEQRLSKREAAALYAASIREYNKKLERLEGKEKAQDKLIKRVILESLV